MTNSKRSLSFVPADEGTWTSNMCTLCDSLPL